MHAAILLFAMRPGDPYTTYDAARDLELVVEITGTVVRVSDATETAATLVIEAESVRAGDAATETLAPARRYRVWCGNMITRDALHLRGVFSGTLLLEHTVARDKHTSSALLARADDLSPILRETAYYAEHQIVRCVRTPHVLNCNGSTLYALSNALGDGTRALVMHRANPDIDVEQVRQAIATRPLRAAARGFMAIEDAAAALLAPEDAERRAVLLARIEAVTHCLDPETRHANVARPDSAAVVVNDPRHPTWALAVRFLAAVRMPLGENLANTFVLLELDARARALVRSGAFGLLDACREIRWEQYDDAHLAIQLRELDEQRAAAITFCTHLAQAGADSGGARAAVQAVSTGGTLPTGVPPFLPAVRAYNAILTVDVRLASRADDLYAAACAALAQQYGGGAAAAPTVLFSNTHLFSDWHLMMALVTLARACADTLDQERDAAQIRAATGSAAPFFLVFLLDAAILMPPVYTAILAAVTAVVGATGQLVLANAEPRDVITVPEPALATLRDAARYCSFAFMHAPERLDHGARQFLSLGSGVSGFAAGVAYALVKRDAMSAAVFVFYHRAAAAADPVAPAQLGTLYTAVLETLLTADERTSYREHEHHRIAWPAWNISQAARINDALPLVAHVNLLAADDQLMCGVHERLHKAPAMLAVALQLAARLAVFHVDAEAASALDPEWAAQVAALHAAADPTSQRGTVDAGAAHALERLLTYSGTPA